MEVKLPTLSPQISFANFDPRALTAKVQETINYDAEDNKGFIEKLRLALKFRLENTFSGNVYNQFVLVLSVLSCFQFIYQTYLDVDTREGSRLWRFMTNLEIIIAAILLFDWSLGLFVAELKMPYITRYVFVILFINFIHHLL